MNFEGTTLLQPIALKVLVVPIGFVPPEKVAAYSNVLLQLQGVELQNLTYQNLEQSGTKTCILNDLSP
jgi:hypothetical protein